MIPPELYEVVAEILIFVDAMDKIKAKMDGPKKQGKIFESGIKSIGGSASASVLTMNIQG